MDAVLIMGLAKDCEKTLLANIRNLTSFFQGAIITWILLESNSSDSTAAISKSLADEHSNFHLIGEPEISFEGLSRGQQMSLRRQALLEAARRIENTESGLAVMVDLDNQLDLKGHYSRIKPNLDNGKAVLAWQKGAYYDIWALRNDLCPTDYTARVRDRILGGENGFRVLKQELFDLQRKMSKKGFPTEVLSGFGGIAVYPKPALFRCNYVESDECEHVPISGQLRNIGVTLTISTQLRTKRVREHTKYATGVGYIVLSLLALWPNSRLNSFLPSRLKN